MSVRVSCGMYRIAGGPGEGTRDESYTAFAFSKKDMSEYTKKNNRQTSGRRCGAFRLPNPVNGYGIPTLFYSATRKLDTDVCSSVVQRVITA